ncbi:MAG: hypothetical protein JWQ09_1795 [Segetibacter sp.]|nr:hypothetical protein [Segetibacter sp.]
MSDGIYITRVEWNQLMKKISFLEEWIISNSKPRSVKKWITEAEAMMLIGCGKSKLQKLRLDRQIEYKYASVDKNGNGKGVMILNASIEAYIEATTKEGIYK